MNISLVYVIACLLVLAHCDSDMDFDPSDYLSEYQGEMPEDWPPFKFDDNLEQLNEQEVAGGTEPVLNQDSDEEVSVVNDEQHNTEQEVPTQEKQGTDETPEDVQQEQVEDTTDIPAEQDESVVEASPEETEPVVTEDKPKYGGYRAPPPPYMPQDGSRRTYGQNGYGSYGEPPRQQPEITDNDEPQTTSFSGIDETEDNTPPSQESPKMETENNVQNNNNYQNYDENYDDNYNHEEGREEGAGSESQPPPYLSQPPPYLSQPPSPAPVEQGWKHPEEAAQNVEVDERNTSENQGMGQPVGSLGSTYDYQDDELMMSAQRAEVGPHEDMPQMVSFIGEIETIGLLMKYEKIWDGFKLFADDSVGYMEKELGIPYPFSYIVFILSSFCSIYFLNIFRNLVCPKKPRDTHVFNNIDSVDLSKLMKLLERIEKQGGGTSTGKAEMGSFRSSASTNASELGEITSQFAKFREELKAIRVEQDKTNKMVATIGTVKATQGSSQTQEQTLEMIKSMGAPKEIHEVLNQQSKMYEMIENIATSQNDLEANVYKAILKLYNKVDKIEKGSKVSSPVGAKERDTSPISFRHRSNLP